MAKDHIIGTNLLTKFHEDRKINVASKVLTRKNAPPPGSHFHEDRTVNVASRVLTRFYYSHIRKTAPPLNWQPCPGHIGIHARRPDLGGTGNGAEYPPRNCHKKTLLGDHVFQANVTILELIQDIIKTNLLTKFHKDWTINVASRVFTRKNALPSGGHVFQPTGIIFELVQDIIGMNLLTKFHEDQTKNVASRVLTRFYYSHIRKNAPPLGSHVFSSKHIIETNLLTKFHEDLDNKCGKSKNGDVMRYVTLQKVTSGHKICTRPAPINFRVKLPRGGDEERIPPSVPHITNVQDTQRDPHPNTTRYVGPGTHTTRDVTRTCKVKTPPTGWQKEVEFI
ncbi:hypothetical protein DPMN_102378 [Dreissena polymorpha]|uniref:Uncharacterized protein n=1 Tax=Dreissena polymorpha TaxID=45954 RepID=A0A9D4R920_DREPO|nr:hypothetical protein DPMN_102378 [Dreissena polymorpha]